MSSAATLWAAALMSYVLLSAAVQHRWRNVGDWMIAAPLIAGPIVLIYLILSGALLP